MPHHKINKRKHQAAGCTYLYSAKRKGLAFDIYQDTDDHDFPYVAVYKDPNDGEVEETAGETPKAAMEMSILMLTDTADECPPDDIF